MPATAFTEGTWPALGQGLPAHFLATEMQRLYPSTRDRGVSRLKAAI